MRVRKDSMQEEASAKSAQGRYVDMPTAVCTLFIELHMIMRMHTFYMRVYLLQLRLRIV